MVHPFDLLRSYVNSTVSIAARAAARLPPVIAARRLALAMSGGGLAVTEAEIARAVSAAEGARACTVLVQGDALRIDMTFDDGVWVAGAIYPHATHFAPRGAKELVFRVDPPELAADRHLRDVVARVSVAIAASLWRSLGPGAPWHEFEAIVDREGALLRVDLRSVPAVRKLSRIKVASLAMDALVLERIDASGGQLKLHLRVGV